MFFVVLSIQQIILWYFNIIESNKLTNKKQKQIPQIDDEKAEESREICCCIFF